MDAGKPKPVAPRRTSVSTAGPDADDGLLLRLAPALFVLIWSTGFVGARASATGAEPFSFLTVRFLLAALLLFIAAWIGRARWPASPRGVVDSLVAGALIQGTYLGGVFWAIYYGLPAGVAALIVALQPLFTSLIAGPTLGERITRAHWLGLAIGLVGVTLVLAPKLQLTGGGITPATVAGALIAVIAISIGSIWQKARAADTDLRAGTGLQFIGGALVVGIAALLSEDLRIDWTLEVSLAMAWLVVALSFGAALLYMLLIRRGAVARVATLFYLVPPCTAVIAWALYGETLDMVQIAGMAVTVAGVAIATRGRV